MASFIDSLIFLCQFDLKFQNDEYGSSIEEDSAIFDTGCTNTSLNNLHFTHGEKACMANVFVNTATGISATKRADGDFAIEFGRPDHRIGPIYIQNPTLSSDTLIGMDIIEKYISLISAYDGKVVLEIGCNEEA